MRRYPMMYLLFIFLSLIAPTGTALPLSELMDRGLFEEISEGNLDAATKTYERVLEASGSQPTYAANAHFRLGVCHMKQGQYETAADAFRKIIARYPNERNVVVLSKNKLQRIEEALAQGVDPREIPGPRFSRHSMSKRVVASWSNIFRPTPFDFSPDGKHILFVGPSDGVLIGKSAPLGLYVSDISGKRIHALLESWGPYHGASIASWSPDGKQIAFAARNREKSKTGEFIYPTSIYIVDLQGGQPKCIKSDIRSELGGLFWTGNGEGITYISSGGGSSPNGINTINVDDGSVTFTPLNLGAYGRSGGYSPDGRWLVFEIQNRDAEDTQATDIWIYPVDGGRAIQLTHAAGFDGHPEWSRDGAAIIFTSDRDGEFNLWIVELDTESGVRRGKPSQITFFSDARIFHPEVLRHDGRLAFFMIDETTAMHVANSDGRGTIVTIGRGHRPQLSPNGNSVFYIRDGAGQRGIFTKELGHGETRSITGHVPLTAFGRSRAFHLSPNGESLAYFRRDGNETNLYVVDSRHGKPRSLTSFNTKEQLVPAWSPDGSLIAYASGDTLYTIDPTGGSPSALAQIYRWDSWSVRWSPDGSKLAALGWRGPADKENMAFVVSASGGDPRTVGTDSTLYKEGLEWHPDGASITYFEYGHESIIRAYLDGRTPTILFDQPESWEYIGKWSPDGRNFFFISSKDNAWNSYAYNVETNHIEQIGENSEGDVCLPYWSSDGKRMTWSSTRHSGQLWLIDGYR